MSRIRGYRLFSIMMLLWLVIALPAAPPLGAQNQALTCDQLVTLATNTAGTACEGLGRNQVCYGNRRVTVEFAPQNNPPFSNVGDRVELLSLRSISTAPLDQLTGDWGVAFLKAQANLPDALPGQNVTFLLFGDATLENVTSDMRAVRLSSGITGTQCEEAPSGVLIQSPTGQQVTMTINGADITLGSTVFMSALPNVSMKLSTLEGVAIVTAMGDTRIVPQGGEIGVRLGGEDGLEAIDVPSALRGFTQVELPFTPLSLLEEPVELPPSLALTGAMGAPTAIPTTAPTTPAISGCAPREDWTFRYTVQLGDTLSGIAARAGVRLDQLMAGNCLSDASRILAGQVLRVPIALPTPRPATATRPPATSTPAVSATIIGPNLRADANLIYYGSCTVVRWDVANINQVYFEGGPAVGSDARQVCPRVTTTYTLSVLRLDGVTQNFTITIYVETTCGNQTCEPGETYITCPQDCG